VKGMKLLGEYHLLYVELNKRMNLGDFGDAWGILKDPLSDMPLNV
jgi:hypothetical protein